MYDKQTLTNKLKQGTCTVTFNKVDGSERVMRCTLQESMLPQYEKKATRNKVVADNLLSVYDVEANDWRSFRVDSVTSFTW